MGEKLLRVQQRTCQPACAPACSSSSHCVVWCCVAAAGLWQGLPPLPRLLQPGRPDPQVRPEHLPPVLPRVCKGHRLCQVPVNQHAASAGQQRAGPPTHSLPPSPHAEHPSAGVRRRKRAAAAQLLLCLRRRQRRPNWRGGVGSRQGRRALASCLPVAPAVAGGARKMRPLCGSVPGSRTSTTVAFFVLRGPAW